MALVPILTGFLFVLAATAAVWRRRRSADVSEIWAPTILRQTFGGLDGFSTTTGEAFSSGLIDVLDDEIFAFSAETYELLYLNKRALAEAGWTTCEAGGKRLHDLFEAFEVRAFQDCIAPILTRKSRSVLFETLFRGKTVEAKLQLEDGADGTPLLIAVLRDVSGRKRVERDMAEFVSTVSHELRAPMTSIKGALALISSGGAGPMSERADAMVQMAQRNVERLLRLVNDLLDLQKLDANMMDLAVTPIDIMAFAQEVVASHSGYGLEFGVDLRCTGPSEPLYVHLNRDGMTQALTNLLSNAVKFSDRGQSVELAVRVRANGVRLTVTDHGMGIPTEAHCRLFSRFVQAHKQIDRQRVGTGLGLSIAKAIVERHGGRIGFDSEIGLGSTFFIDLPFNPGSSNSIALKA
jgi:signal transduction histidine kinase